MAKQVASWEAGDGSIHRTEEAATARDGELAVRKWADDSGIGRGGEWSAEMVVDAMLRDAGKLGALLTDYAVGQHAAGRSSRA